MKFALNLSLSQSFRHRHALAWSVPLLAGSLVLLARLLFSIQVDWRDYRTVGQAVSREEARLNDLAAREAALQQKLDRPESQAVLREVQFVNFLIDQRRFSLTDLTAKVTALLPPQARLTTLRVPDSSGDPLVQFGIEGSSEEPVETFVSNLEDSPDFRDVTVTNQGFEEKSGGAPVSITCSARYVGGRSSSPEDRPAPAPRLR